MMVNLLRLRSQVGRDLRCRRFADICRSPAARYPLDNRHRVDRLELSYGTDHATYSAARAEAPQSNAVKTRGLSLGKSK